MRRALVAVVTSGVVLSATAALAQPRVTLDVTIEVDRGFESCPTTEYVQVRAGTAVRVCYQAWNSGSVDLLTHTIVDSELGTLLSSFLFTMAPNASAFLTQVTTVDESTFFTGTWTASLDGPGSVFDSDTAFAVVPEAGAEATSAAVTAALLASAAVRTRRWPSAIRHANGSAVRPSAA